MNGDEINTLLQNNNIAPAIILPVQVPAIPEPELTPIISSEDATTTTETVVVPSSNEPVPAENNSNEVNPSV